MSELDKHRTPELEVVKAQVPSRLPASANRVISAGLAEYFRCALERLNYLEYGDPAEYLLRVRGLEASKSPLDSIWVPPRFKQQDEAGDDVLLETLLKDPSPCLLVLADPGCGKSTLARFLTCLFINRFCQAEEDCFGLFVPLSTLRISGMTNQEAIVTCAAKYLGLDRNQQVLSDLSENLSKAFVILDGFDELPVARRAVGDQNHPVPLRREAAVLIRALRYVQTLQAEGSIPRRSLVTSRSRDYFEDRESSLGTVPHYFVAKLTPSQMNFAVHQWHEAVKARAREEHLSDAQFLDSLNERRRGIQSTLRENFELATVCLTPLMLSVLQTVYSDKSDLPSSVSQLCWRAVRWFLVEKHAGTSQDSFVTENEFWLLETVTQLGWYVQERLASGQSKAFNDNDLRRVTRSACTISRILRADYETQEDAITRVVAFLRRGHGILVKVSHDEFDFAHSVFREVMAGRALAKLAMPERRAYALRELWHGPIRYWAGLRAAEADGLYEIGAFVGELAEDIKDGNIYAILARGEMLVEVCSIVAPQRFTSDLKNHIAAVRSELCLSLERSDLRLQHRIRIGDLLAVLGDPRLETSPTKRIQWVPAGEYRIGREISHKTRIPKYQTCPACPSISGHLNAFGISSFLVTNMEYKSFIDAGGYDNRKYWPSDTAWKWASNDAAMMEILVNRARDVASTHLSSELAGQRLVPDEIPERCVQMIRRHLPLYWSDPALNRPNQPVVGINWWEALAYCLWLDETLRRAGELDIKQHIRLPTEAEWETIARLCGNGNVYPWLEGDPANCSHVRAAFQSTNDPPVFRSCGVGLFQYVRSSFPVFDLVGNVWEWTSSKSGPYTTRSFEQSAEVNGMEDRIARGSSWLSSEEESTEVTFRSFDPPYNAYEDLGFRIAIGLDDR